MYGILTEYMLCDIYIYNNILYNIYTNTHVLISC